MPIETAEAIDDSTHKSTAVESIGELIESLTVDGIAPNRASCPALIEQLRQAATSKINAIICCAIDSDPLVPVNATVASESKADVVEGLKLLARLLKPRRIWFVAEPAVLSRCKASHRSASPMCSVRPVTLRADYPLTDARLLLRTVLRRRVKPTDLPTRAKALVLDAPAAADLGCWARTGVAGTTVPMGVRDHVKRTVKLVRTPRGASIGQLLEAMGIPAEAALVRSGDFLRDQFVQTDHRLGNGELCLHITAPQRPEPAEPCIRCAWCVEACPARIHPAGLLEAAQRNDLAMAHRFGLRSCIDCGICSYVCPSHLPLLQSIRQLREAAEVAEPQ